tara:strand:- start:253 stop:735 length:483 start_codon:yes stop_codon:yes gene_type:complete
MSTQRRKRFKRLSLKRKNNVIYAINSLAKLSVKSNYNYKDDEVWDIVAELMWEIKSLLLEFSKHMSEEEKLEQLIKLDALQLATLKITDPGLHKLIMEKYKVFGSLEPMIDNLTVEPKYLKSNIRMRLKKIEETYKQLVKSENIVEGEIERLQKIMSKNK